MNRRDFLKAMGFGAASLTVPGCVDGFEQLTAKSQANKKPNFVFILIDDMGLSDVACYGSKFH